MRSINVTELKDNLGDYLTFAKSGESIVIHDFDVPVAKLVPFAEDKALVRQNSGFTDEELELAAAGLLRLPETPWTSADLEDFLDSPWPAVNGNAGSDAIIAERNEGR
jgi:antitoxin (DNA-binding transcriptional repressor) of toxin-antitoxin stability system